MCMHLTITRNDLHRWFTGDKILILGGDFNCVENKSIDKIGGNDAYGDVGGGAF